MGGAFTAVADDSNAIYYNPAGLSQVKGFGLGILNPQVEASKDAIDLFGDLQDVDMDDSAAVADVMRKYIGDNDHIKLATDTYIGFNVGKVGIMVDAVAQGHLDIRIRNPVWPEAQVDAIADYGLMVGAGLPVPAVKGLSLGATFKGLSRTSINASYTADEITDDNFDDMIDDDRLDGSSVGLDLGVLYTTDALPMTSLNVAMVAQNIPEMKFGDAADQKTQFNAGIALSQKVIGLRFTEALDIHDVTDNLESDESNEKKIHMGVEVALPAILSARVGLNQGYTTAGVTLDFKVLKFDVATYGEEIGVVGGQKEDRRYVAQISAGWLW
jgi:hypothetical protein